jgi:hypothetical protein
MAFGGSGLIRGFSFGGSGLIRGFSFGGSGLIRGFSFGGSGLIRWKLLYYIILPARYGNKFSSNHLPKMYMPCQMNLHPFSATLNFVFLPLIEAVLRNEPISNLFNKIYSLYVEK